MTRDQFEAGFGSLLESVGIKHFSAWEICRVGRRANAGPVQLKAPPVALWKNAIPTLQILDELREALGPVIVNSGYRDPEYNKAVGGEKASLHMTCNAFDVSVIGKTPKEVYDWLDAHPNRVVMGLGLYSSFVHVDTRGLIGRPAPARW